MITIIIILVLCITTLLALGLWVYQEERNNEDTSQEIADEIAEQALEEERDQALKPSPVNYLAEELVYEGDAPVYVTIYSHNEDSWDTLVNTEEKYLSYREALIERAEVLAAYDVEWNWQSDQPVVAAMAEYENDRAFMLRDDVSYGQEMNVLEYLETLGVHFDPHAHTNNYADIAHLMKNYLGVTPTGVIGGVAHVACGEGHLGFLAFESWYEAIQLESDGLVHGVDYPNATWRPEILSDPGMGGHYFDDYSTGLWRPGDEADFYLNFPLNDIVYVGEGYPHDVTIIGDEHASGSKVYSEDGSYIKELVEKIADGELPTGTIDGKKFMYTASVHMRDKEIVTSGTVAVDSAEGIAAFMDEVQGLRDSGKIIFVDFEEAVEIWQDEYEEVPWRTGLETFSFYDELKTEAEDYCEEKSPRNQ